MLSTQGIETTLGGRYLTRYVTPYRFDEFLDATGKQYDEAAVYSTSGKGAISAAFESFYVDGGFPSRFAMACRESMWRAFIKRCFWVTSLLETTCETRRR